jgi:CheY-like chemotaxis protein
VEVALTSTEQDSMELRIADDGRGFDLAQAQQHGGLGLVSIDERVRLVAGHVRIRSENRAVGAGAPAGQRADAEVGTEMSRPRVLLAEDHTAVANSLVRFLRDDVDIVATVRDGEALVDAAQRLRPDVIIADIHMPVMGGLAALQQLRTRGLDVPMLLLTAHDDAELAAQAMRAGADGFVLKQTAAVELLTAIGEVLQGRSYLSPRLSKESTPRVKPSVESDDRLAGPAHA